MNEKANNEMHNMYIDLLSSYLFDITPALISLIAAIIILIASIKLFRNCKLPGVNYIFYSTAGTFIGIILYTVILLIIDNGDNYLFEQITSLVFSLIFSLGAYGFWILSRHLIQEKQ